MQNQILSLQHLSYSPAQLLNKLALLALMCAALLIGSGKSFADTRNDEGAKERGHMMKELNLNDQQKEAFKNAMQQMHESMEGFEEMHEQIRAVVQSDNYDEKKIRDIIEKNDKTREDNIVKGTKAMNEFYKSLSPEQKEKFTKLQKEAKEHMKDRMKARKD